MQKYKQKGGFAAFSDRILRVSVACFAGIGWFVMLWGVRLTSMTAGIALGGMFWLCIRQFCKYRTQKHEKQMRITIGGELALQEFLMLPPQKAGRKAAVWVHQRFPIEIKHAIDWGVTGKLDEKETLLRVLSQHEKTIVSVQQVLEVAREAHQVKADQCILCLTAPISKEGIEFANSCTPVIKIVTREEMIQLAGMLSPASDEQLCALGNKRKKTYTIAKLADQVLSQKNSRRFLCYGIAITLMAIMTGKWFYPIPASICLLLYIGCKVKKKPIRSKGI